MPGFVEWHNPFVAEMMDRESVVGLPLLELFPALAQAKDRPGKMEIAVGADIYELLFKPAEKLLYIRDITEMWQLTKAYEEEKLALGIVFIDNLDEVTQSMDDQQRTTLLSRVTTEITEWSQRENLYIKRLNSDRFLLITDQKALRQLELTKFIILDEVREMTCTSKFR